MNKTYYYKTFSDDFVHSGNQKTVPREDYQWVHENVLYRFFSCIVYGLFWIFSLFYVRGYLGARVRNGKVLKPYRKQAYFVYGNHTQVVGDVFIAAQACGGKRYYAVAGWENLAVPVIGRILPMLGALPVPENREQMKQFLTAMSKRVEQKRCILIFPEAHVWPYYTKIRPLPATSFRFPVEYKAPAFAMTVTYQKRRLRKKPGITVYIDGPFAADQDLNKKQQQRKLRDEIQQCMEERAKCSSFEYIHYEEETS